MVKSEADVVKDFNEIVNMTADELDAFLKTEGSTSTGWSKDDGSGESIGHESGRKIVDILKRNPDKDPSKYTDEDKEHMRRVVSYCKRHLAQEEHLKQDKGPEELEKSKSTRSLKNWGHDPMKTLKGGANKSKPASKGKPVSKTEEKTEKPASKGKPVSRKEDKKEETKEGKKTDKAEKPVSKGKPASKKAEPAKEKPAEKPVSKGKPASKKGKADEASAETGEKRVAAADKPAEGGKPPSKKAKTTKPPSEGSRKPPSRGAKKA